MIKRALFPGSFDPFTIGHYHLVCRALQVFDEIIVAVGINQTKKTLFSLEKRVDLIRQAFADEPRVKVQTYQCLTVDFAQQMQAQYLLRGLRTVADFEYERSMADANLQLSGIETVSLFTAPEYAYISSSLVRDLYTFGKDIAPFLPPHVII